MHLFSGRNRQPSPERESQPIAPAKGFDFGQCSPAWAIAESEGGFNIAFKTRTYAPEVIEELVFDLHSVRAIQKHVPNGLEKAPLETAAIYKTTIGEFFGGLIEKYPDLSNSLQQIWTAVMLGRIDKIFRRQGEVEISCENFNPTIQVVLEVDQHHHLRVL